MVVWIIAGVVLLLILSNSGSTDCGCSSCGEDFGDEDSSGIIDCRKESDENEYYSYKCPEEESDIKGKDIW